MYAWSRAPPTPSVVVRDRQASTEEAEVAVIPDTVGGLPLHALAVHATVVMVPLAALLGVLFAVPRLRRWAALPLALVAVAAAVSTYVSVESGEALKEAGGLGAAGLGGPVADLVERHEDLAGQLLWLVVGYAVLAVAAVLVATRSDRAATSATRRQGVVVTALSVLLVLGAGVVGFQTYRVGDAGTEAVWNPSGNTDYSD